MKTLFGIGVTLLAAIFFVAFLSIANAESVPPLLAKPQAKSPVCIPPPLLAKPVVASIQAPVVPPLLAKPTMASSISVPPLLAKPTPPAAASSVSPSSQYAYTPINAPKPAPAAEAKPPAPPPAPVGRVVWVKGTFVAERGDQKRNLDKSAVIYLQDTLITDDNTQAQIAFTDNTLMTFRPSTKFYVKEYSYKPEVKQGSVGKYFMNLIEGGFRTITGLIPKANPSDYQVNTPVATIGVRGTDYTVFVGDNNAGKSELYIGQLKGVPCVSDKVNVKCFDDKVKYGQVADGKIQTMTVQPQVLATKLDVVPATIAPFSPGEVSGQLPSGARVKPMEVSVSTKPATTSSSGSSGSFCIK